MSSLINGNSRSKLDEGEKCTYVVHSTSSSMQEYPLFHVIPRTCAFSIFDMGEDKSYESVGEYTVSTLFDLTAPKYVVTELKIKFEVTYTYQGNTQTVIADCYIDKYEDFYKSASVKVDFPDEVRGSYTGQYALNGKGDTYTQTTYYPDLDSWSVRILEVSGLAEVMEVSGK